MGSRLHDRESIAGLLNPAALTQRKGWHAALAMHFRARVQGVEQLFEAGEMPNHASGAMSHQTVLRHQHLGPLRIQKALYPEGPHCCHAVIIHPPGGIACGDHLQIDAQIDANAHALVITPAATKWYGAFDQSAHASQTVSLRVQGLLEWLPAETIVFDQARVRSQIDVHVGPDGQMFGWDQLIFGRKGSGESFSTGLFDQRMQVILNNDKIWVDRLRLLGSDPLIRSPVGLAGHDSCQIAWLITRECEPITDDLLEAARHANPDIAFTRIHPRLLVMRSLASALILRTRFERLWQWIRPHWINLQPHIPRLWAT